MYLALRFFFSLPFFYFLCVKKYSRHWRINYSVILGTLCFIAIREKLNVESVLLIFQRVILGTPIIFPGLGTIYRFKTRSFGCKIRTHISSFKKPTIVFVPMLLRFDLAI